MSISCQWVMRRIAKVDNNQSEIVATLRKYGASVQCLHTVGKGCPDLLVGFGGLNFLLEVKDGTKSPSQRKLTKDEQHWHNNWLGVVNTVNSPDEALEIIKKPFLRTERLTTDKEIKCPF